MVIPGMGKKAAGGGDREDLDTEMDGLHMILQNITYCCPGEMLLFQIPSTQWYPVVPSGEDPDKKLRIAIVNSDRCKPKKWGHLRAKKG